MKNPKKYRLSKQADIDIQEIFLYTKQSHSLKQAKLYLGELELSFERIILNPYIGRYRKELASDVLSVNENKHVVFYQIHTDEILVVRILHSSKDIPKQF